MSLVHSVSLTRNFLEKFLGQVNSDNWFSDDQRSFTLSKNF